MSNDWREGYTTGACAAAGAKAATQMLIKQKPLQEITITLPIGKKASFKVFVIGFNQQEASCYVIKDAGDDPDITHGVQIIAKVVKNTTKNIKIKGGTGIGIVTKPGLPVAVGQPAINPVPRQMIISEILEIFTIDNWGLDVEISVPQGSNLAEKTLNSHLGIMGGLSILGTTGVVKPMSEEAFKESLVPQLKVSYALGHPCIILTPGNIGMKSALHYGFQEDMLCQTSNFIGFMLDQCVKIGFEKIILWGHPGKLVKLACGNFHTHNRISDGRMETLTAHLALLDAPKNLLSQIMDCTTTDAAITLINQYGYEQIWRIISQKISLRAERFLFNKVQVGTVLLQDRYKILTFDENAQKIGEDLGWPVLQ